MNGLGADIEEARRARSRHLTPDLLVALDGLPEQG